MRRAVAHAYAAHRRNAIAKLITPTALTFFVTNRCNARCKHCFYWQELNQSGDELTIDEIEKIAASLVRPVYLSLTGGEPTLRKDLMDICEVFYRVNNCRNMALATNGFLPDRTTTVCNHVLDQLQLDSLGVQVSLDGLEETHARIRGVRDGFEKALGTIDRLTRLARDDKRLCVAVSITLQKNNLNEIEKMIEVLLPFKIPIRFAILRGQSFGTYALPASVRNDIDPKDKDTPLVDMDTLEGVFTKISTINDRSPYRFWTELQQKKIQVSLRMMKEKRQQVPCYAGAIDGVLYSNGDVALCELTRPVGNIREFDCDFNATWNSARAKKQREAIRKCFCVHGCNLITSLMLDPEVIATL